MCGILFSLQAGTSAEPSEGSDSTFQELFRELRIANGFRGPDAQDSVHTRVQNLSLDFFASELRLRGDAFIAQPHRDPNGNVLCWNGEIFEGIDVASHENDGEKLFSLLTGVKTPEEFSDLLGSIEGPFAIVFYHCHSQRIYFARDPLGRRSLLIHRPTPVNPYFLLASVSVGSHPGYAFEELSTDCIYSLDVSKLFSSTNIVTDFIDCVDAMPRRRDGSEAQYAVPSRINRSLPEDIPKAQDLDHVPAHLSGVVDELITQLDRSVMLRVRNIPSRNGYEGQARVAVLFSGGIDSTTLAFLAHRHVDPAEPIDLLNVAFENPRKISVQVEGNIGGLPKREKKQKMRERLDYSTVEVSYDVPDRITGLTEVEELRRLCPGRVWNFVEINVPFEEYQGAKSTVEALMFPSRTVMDLSLAIALYFAARGVGKIRSHADALPRPYTSPARVLLNGLGSDELLGGYGRHRTAFRAGGWQAIVDELQLEIDRIPTRNLGRDDRVISSHGKETRHPFLSLSVVSYLAQLPVHLKLDPRLEAGLGEKMLLRFAARKLGLKEASGRKKRAMQFGSHSARMAPGEGDKKGDLLLR
ncbi:asparagine synthase-domain-containing protein [Amylocystis lapponica]|nr:asparagine synthase-domain-containing protein [Amylocystis lapponica]